ncbi:hypothetical protein XHC_1794 [Xanthomonas hortorum pv. carotae str. M081]|nr:hypothetical protein XHC_1794 [Xanthomonas hortorum pv. carotae str. M081]
MATLKGRTLSKTYVIKKSTIQALVGYLGEKTKSPRPYVLVDL